MRLSLMKASEEALRADVWLCSHVRGLTSLARCALELRIRRPGYRPRPRPTTSTRAGRAAMQQEVRAVAAVRAACRRCGSCEQHRVQRR